MTSLVPTRPPGQQPPPPSGAERTTRTALMFRMTLPGGTGRFGNTDEGFHLPLVNLIDTQPGFIPAGVRRGRVTLERSDSDDCTVRYDPAHNQDATPARPDPYLPQTRLFSSVKGAYGVRPADVDSWRKGLGKTLLRAGGHLSRPDFWLSEDEMTAIFTAIGLDITDYAICLPYPIEIQSSWTSTDGSNGRYPPGVRLQNGTYSMGLPSAQSAHARMRGRRFVYNAIHWEAHWGALVWDRKQGDLYVFDSMAPGRDSRCVAAARAWVGVLHAWAQPYNFNVYSAPLTTQPNSWGCGWLSAYSVILHLRSFVGYREDTSRNVALVPGALPANCDGDTSITRLDHYAGRLYINDWTSGSSNAVAMERAVATVQALCIYALSARELYVSTPLWSEQRYAGASGDRQIEAYRMYKPQYRLLPNEELERWHYGNEALSRLGGFVPLRGDSVLEDTRPLGSGSVNRMFRSRAPAQSFPCFTRPNSKATPAPDGQKEDQFLTPALKTQYTAAGVRMRDNKLFPEPIWKQPGRVPVSAAGSELSEGGMSRAEILSYLSGVLRQAEDDVTNPSPAQKRGAADIITVSSSSPSVQEIARPVDTITSGVWRMTVGDRIEHGRLLNYPNMRLFNRFTRRPLEQELEYFKQNIAARLGEGGRRMLYEYNNLALPAHNKDIWQTRADTFVTMAIPGLMRTSEWLGLVQYVSENTGSGRSAGTQSAVALRDSRDARAQRWAQR